MSKCIGRPIGERQPNLCIYIVLLLTDHKQCFSLSALSRRSVESYSQPVAAAHPLCDLIIESLVTDHEKVTPNCSIVT